MATYSLAEASSWLKHLSKGMEDAARRGLLSAAQRTVAHVQNDIIPATVPTPVARGVYRAGWVANATPKGAEVVNDVPHAAFIEEGVRGANVKIGRAMIEALAEWVRMKGLGGRVVVGKSGVARLQRVSADEARQIAWAVAKTLQKKGIFDGGKGLGIFRRAQAMIPQFIREEVQRELQAAAGGGRL
jgi:hypothetical protein